MSFDEEAFEKVLDSRHWAGAKYLLDFVKQYEYAKGSKSEPTPLIEGDFRAAIDAVIGSADAFLSGEVVSRDFMRYWHAYSGDIAKKVIAALLERFDIKRKP